MPITSASITLRNLTTGIQTAVSTDELGAYQFLNVKAGRHSVSAEAAGFKKAVADEVIVTVYARQRVDLTLEVGAVTESITVTGAAAVLQTESSSRGTL